jgi:hypothetical protein
MVHLWNLSDFVFFVEPGFTYFGVRYWHIAHLKYASLFISNFLKNFKIDILIFWNKEHMHFSRPLCSTLGNMMRIHIFRWCRGSTSISLDGAVGVEVWQLISYTMNLSKSESRATNYRNRLCCGAEYIYVEHTFLLRLNIKINFLDMQLGEFTYITSKINK